MPGQKQHGIMTTWFTATGMTSLTKNCWEISGGREAGMRLNFLASFRKATCGITRSQEMSGLDGR